jgi:hypothetical protein
VRPPLGVGCGPVLPPLGVGRGPVLPPLAIGRSARSWGRHRRGRGLRELLPRARVGPGLGRRLATGSDVVSLRGGGRRGEAWSRALGYLGGKIRDHRRRRLVICLGRGGVPPREDHDGDEQAHLHPAGQAVREALRSCEEPRCDAASLPRIRRSHNEKRCKSAHTLPTDCGLTQQDAHLRVARAPGSRVHGCGALAGEDMKPASPRLGQELRPEQVARMRRSTRKAAAPAPHIVGAGGRLVFHCRRRRRRRPVPCDRPACDVRF